MLKRIVFLGLLPFILCFCGSASAGPDMNPGKWEITSVTEMKGMPVQIPPVTRTQCLTKNDMVPQSQQPGQECQFPSVKVSGNTVSWTMSCSNPGQTMEGKGRVIYEGDQMHGTMNMVMEEAGMEMIVKIKGRRIGDCD